MSPHIILNASNALHLSRVMVALNGSTIITLCLTNTGDSHHDCGVRCQCFRVHDEEDDLDEAQRRFDYLSGARPQQQTNVVEQLFHGRHFNGIWKTKDIPELQLWVERSPNLPMSGDLPLYSNTRRVRANTVHVIMVTEPVNPA